MVRPHDRGIAANAGGLHPFSSRHPERRPDGLDHPHPDAQRPTPSPSRPPRPPTSPSRCTCAPSSPSLAIFPLVSIGMLAMAPFTESWHPVLRAFVLTLVVVPLAVYLVVPRLLRAHGRLVVARARSGRSRLLMGEPACAALRGLLRGRLSGRLRGDSSPACPRCRPRSTVRMPRRGWIRDNPEPQPRGGSAGPDRLGCDGRPHHRRRIRP